MVQRTRGIIQWAPGIMQWARGISLRAADPVTEEAADDGRQCDRAGLFDANATGVDELGADDLHCRAINWGPSPPVTAADIWMVTVPPDVESPVVEEANP